LPASNLIDEFTAAPMPKQPSRPQIITDPRAMTDWSEQQRSASRRIGVVPTMGALHAGHVSLVERSCQECDATVLTIFVNPTQFGPHEDFQKYPRTLDSDLAAIAHLPVEVAFCPTTSAMYPPEHATRVEVAGPALPWEGAHRPGHFSGVATIVLKLFEIVRPQVAYFGQKDYQQTLVVRRMVEDLDVPVELIICPTLREADGLAMSSRNAYLSAESRQKALRLSQSLKLAQMRFRAGERNAVTVRAEMLALFHDVPGVQVDYVALVDPPSLAEVVELTEATVALLAVRVDGTRLIDNACLGS
jgi:pantoate--beta-alanine ligase